MQFDISAPATWVPIVAGVIIPFFVALIARQDGNATVKSLLAALSAALVALGLYLGDVSHVQSWKGAVSVFVLALITAGASRVTLTEHKVAELAAKAPGGIG